MKKTSLTDVETKEGRMAFNKTLNKGCWYADKFLGARSNCFECPFAKCIYEFPREVLYRMRINYGGKNE